MDRAAKVTQLLKEAAKCGIGDSSDVREVIEDYFCQPSSEFDDEASGSDIDAGGTDSSDAELDISGRASPMPSTSTAGRHDDDDDDDDEEETAADDTRREEVHAMDRAMDLFECVDMPRKKCHCSCKLNNGQSCISQFTEDKQESIRLNTQELTSYEKDLLLLGIICASLNASDETLSVKKTSVRRKTSRIRCFYYEHYRICRDTFLFLMNISKEKLTNLKKWYLENGIHPRKKKSGGRQKTALSFAEIQRVSRFILNFAEQHSIILPGRIPGFKRDDVKVLPSCETKSSVWRQHKAASTEGQRIVRCSTFRVQRSCIPVPALIRIVTMVRVTGEAQCLHLQQHLHHCVQFIPWEVHCLLLHQHRRRFTTHRQVRQHRSPFPSPPAPRTLYHARPSPSNVHQTSPDDATSWPTRMFYILEKQNSEMAEMKRMLSSLMKKVATSREEPSSLPERIQFPLASEEAVQALEQDLADKETEKALKHHLAVIGGENLKDVTIRIMKIVFSQQLA